MLSFHTVLHPTDFSTGSAAAFRLAVELARTTGGRMILLHVQPIPVVVYGAGVLPIAPGESVAAVRRQLAELAAQAPDLHIETRLVEGEPAQSILAAARETHSDVIVMGTHGRTGLGRMLMGSVAEAVVRRAECPVLTVKLPVTEAVPVQSATAEAVPAKPAPELAHA